MCWCIKIEYNKRRNVNLNYCYNVKKYLGKDCKGCLDVIAIIPLDVGKVTHVALKEKKHNLHLRKNKIIRQNSKYRKMHCHIN